MSYNIHVRCVFFTYNYCECGSAVLYLLPLSSSASSPLFLLHKRGILWLDSHLTQKGCDGTLRSGQDPSVCVPLTDLSHIITMATGAVAMATASAQSVLQLDARVVAAWVTVFGGRQVSLTFTKVNPPLLCCLPPYNSISYVCSFLPPLPLKVNNTLLYCPPAPTVPSCLF